MQLQPYLHSLWELLGGGMQEHVALVRQVHVDAVGAEVVGHRQLVVAVVTHLLHDLPVVDERRKRTVRVTSCGWPETVRKK